ncbi:hypothetical protein [Flavobacterium sp.]|uniref:hypothetical protein n=1 Tax=Flavobacterium sp. TaxID=239 RepID=UPI0037537079
MASIKIVSGKYESKLSTTTKWVLTADESCLFEVPDWIPQAKVNPKGGFTPVIPTEIEKPKGVTWEIKDKSKKIVLATVKGNVLDKFKIAINKKYSGSYGYTLEATLDGVGTKASAFILGSCEAKVISATWSKQELASDSTEIKYGNIVYVRLATEGLNGDNLTFEFYNKKDEKTPIETITQECLNGDAQVKIATFKAFKGDPTKIADLEDFFVKVKNTKGVYIKNGKEDKVVSFQIKKPLLVSPVADIPTNLTPIKVGEPDKSNLSTGIISLEKIAVKTTYDVCNDEVDNFSDFKNFWILENDGKYYHWLKKSLIGITEADDKKKPAAIPITLASTDNFTFKATFKTILPIDGIEVRVRDKDNKYTFTTKPHAKQAKDALYEIEFKSTNTPYKDTIQYFETFELIFDYSLDKKSWTPLGSAMFCFYLTWKKPMWDKFEGDKLTPNETVDMMLLCKKSFKKNILETLLWLGCNQASGKGNLSKNNEENEEQIISSVFKQFTSKKVLRKREGSYITKNWTSQGMGYWRGISAVDAQSGLPAARVQPRKFYDSATGKHIDRNSRVILKYGEFRCGEWSDFYTYISMCQGIPLSQFAIFSGRGDNQNYYFKIDPVTKKPSYINPNLSKVDASGKLIENYYANWVFYVKGGWTFSDPKEPVLSASIANRAQGNSNPLHEFSDHVFVLFERSGKKLWLDPSYGLSSTTKHPTNNDLLKDYASAALERMGYLDIYSGNYKTIGTVIENHLVKMIISGLYDSRSEVREEKGVISIIDSLGKTIKTF